MKRLVLLLVGGVLLTGGFYVVWPAWTLHRIAEAIRADDSATLERKIDFPSIRASARAPLIEEVTRRYDQFQGSGGNLLGVFGPQMKKEVLPRLVDSALEAIATPANVLYFARNRVALKDALRRAMEQRIVVGNTRWGGTQMPPAAGTAGQPNSLRRNGDARRRWPAIRLAQHKADCPGGAADIRDRFPSGRQGCRVRTFAAAGLHRDRLARGRADAAPVIVQNTITWRTT